MLAINPILKNNTLMYKHEAMLMGELFEISIVGEKPSTCTEQLNLAFTELARVDKLLSTFGNDSCINKINKHAGIKPIKANTELFRLIERAIEIAAVTHGAFDIIYTAHTLPPHTYTYQDIVLDTVNQTVFLKQEDMRIGFAANGKGYAADRAKYVLQMNGANSGVINAGGDLLTWGLQPDNTPWTVAAADPGQANSAYAHINISNMAIAYAANSHKYTDISNHDQAKKNRPNSATLSRVGIVGPTAELADALSSPVLNMGINQGIELINSFNQIACTIIDENQNIRSSAKMSSLTTVV